jgi:hypothetical protein
MIRFEDYYAVSSLKAKHAEDTEIRIRGTTVSLWSVRCPVEHVSSNAIWEKGQKEPRTDRTRTQMALGW